MRISVVGDFCPVGRFHSEDIKTPQDSVFSVLYPTLSNSHLSIVNLECPVVEDIAYKIEKQGPSLKCKREDVKYLKDSGFNLVTLANNHIKDYGEKGIENTIRCVEDLGMNYTGVGRNLIEASEVIYYTAGEEIIAIINCCEHEFSIATKNQAGANPINPISQWYNIREAKQKANYVVVITHGGNEHYALPSPRMKQLCHFYIDAGADAVINHHQHCYSGYEIYNEKMIFYGLGNFCFDDPYHIDEKWHTGFMVTIDLGKQLDFNITPFYQYYKSPRVELLDEEKKEMFNRYIILTNEIISDDERLAEEYSSLVASKSRSMILSFMPYSNRYLKALAYKHLLPSFLNKKRIVSLFDIINCESHRDILIDVLNNCIHEKDF